jgi:hypothetical protein
MPASTLAVLATQLPVLEHLVDQINGSVDRSPHLSAKDLQSLNTLADSYLRAREQLQHTITTLGVDDRL